MRLITIAHYPLSCEFLHFIEISSTHSDVYFSRYFADSTNRRDNGEIRIYLRSGDSIRDGI